MVSNSQSQRSINSSATDSGSQSQRGSAIEPGESVARWRWRLVAGGLVIVAFLMGIGFCQVIGKWRGTSATALPTDTEKDDPQQTLKRLSLASQSIAERTRKAVVRVEATNIQVDAADDEMAQLFGALPPAFGQGSGVIVDADGFVLTNYHVIRGAKDVAVIVEGSRRFPATMVGYDALTDLAVLRIDARDLNTITWGDSNELQVSAFVWAIGSPFGLEGSVSFGIVSAKNRDTLGTSPFQAFLQTDAAVNPGNSGGPLVDADGQMIGINTAILGRTFQGISFAIPSNTAREIYERLRKFGHVARGWLGVSVDRLSDQRAAQLMREPGHGIYVVSVASDGPVPGPARQAGISPGDVLTRWNDQAVNDPIEFSRLVAQTPIGSKAQVTVIRDGREMTFPLVVGERPH